jgi:hypothetical protein
MSLNETSKQEVLAELGQFINEFARYKDFVIMPEKKRVAVNVEAEFQKLRLKLLREYGRLKPVIEKYSGPTRVHIPNVRYEYEAFASVLGNYEEFGPRNLKLLVDSAITAINITIGSLEKGLESEQVPLEAIYPSGTPYNAYKDIRDKLTTATRKLIIVDPYVDSTLFNMLEKVQHGVAIQVLTRNMKGDFKLAGQKFNEQREKAQQGILEVRKSGKIHDRFVVGDDKFFHLGASIKDAGTKMCAMSEFEGSDIKSKLTETISGYWAEAEIVL